MRRALSVLYLRSIFTLAISVCCGGLVVLDAAGQGPSATVGGPTSGTDSKVAGSAKVIQWSDLAPAQGQPFFDPFTKLSKDQIVDLSYVIRVRELIADDKIRADGVDATEAAEFERKLSEQGIDIGWLVAQRNRVQQIRGLQVERQAKSVADSIRGHVVSITGFVIPIKMEKTRLKEFFLVPTFAACSHEDPPPRLQAVFVSSDQGFVYAGRRTPVQVRGEIEAETTVRKTVNASGQVNVYAAYAMNSPQIRVSQAKGKIGESEDRRTKSVNEIR